MNSLIVAFTPHPYLALHFYDTLPNFIDNIDEMFVGIEGEDTQFNIEVKEFIRDLFKGDKIKSFIYEKPLDQGEVFDRLYKHCLSSPGEVKNKGDILITMDSDFIITEKNYLEKWIRVIKSDDCDCIGSTGGHIDEGVREVILHTVKMNNIGRISRVNPFLSFWKMSILRQMGDFSFAGKNVKKNDVLFPKAGILAPADGYVDPFVLAFLLLSEYTDKVFITKDEYPPDCFHYGGLSWTYRSYLVNTKKKITPDGTEVGRNNMRMYHLAGHVALFENYKDRFPYQDYNDFVAETLEQHKGLCEQEGQKQLLESYVNTWNEIIKL